MCCVNTRSAHLTCTMTMCGRRTAALELLREQATLGCYEGSNDAACNGSLLVCRA